MAYPNQYGYGQAGYPTYLPQQSYNAQQYAPQMGAMQQIQQPQQPSQGAPIWVQGEAGAKSFLVAPSQTVWLIDSENPVFYIKTADASGVPFPLRIFDFKERTAGTQHPVQAAQAPAVEYVTRAEFEAFVAKLAQMTAAPAQQEQPQRMRRARETESEKDG